MKLNKEIYKLNAIELSKYLLGKYLCRNINGEIIKKRITETEAYFGEDDTACHAHKGRTKRTEIMFASGGKAYIYLCYGIHYMLNVVSGEEGSPQAVLIRGIEGFNGPGKLTKALKIDKSLNGEDLIVSDSLWIGDNSQKVEYICSKRVGINYATEEYRNKLWNFKIKTF